MSPCNDDSELFKILFKQSYTAIPDSIIDALTKDDLSATDLFVFLFLWSTFQKNLNYLKKISPVVISITKISDKINKSKRSVSNSLRKLESLNWIYIKSRYSNDTGSQVASYYWITIPDRIRPLLFNKPARSKTSTQTSTQTKSQKPKPTISKNEHQDNLDNLALHKQYVDKYNQLKKDGNSRRLSAQLALELFSSKEQQKIFDLYKQSEPITNQVNAEKSFNLSYPPCKILHGGDAGSCMPNNNINNIYYNNNNNNPNSVDKFTYDNIASRSSEYNLIYNLESDIEKTVTNILIKNHALGKIHIKILNNRRIYNLTKEIIFHIENKPQNFTKLKALNSALKMIQHGAWGVPKKMLYQQSIAKQQSQITNLQQIK